MNRVSYDGDRLTMTVEGLDDVVETLGGLYQKTPAAVKTALNATTRQARKLMLARTTARYAVNSRGLRRLKELKQRRKATNRSLTAELFISSLRNDLGYFDTDPAVPTHFTGGAWRKGPEVFRGRVLKSSAMKPLAGKGNQAKAFLAEFQSGHIGMVQRVIGSHSDETVTKSGAPRWRNRRGDVEKLMTVPSASATAMHHTVWPMVAPEVEDILEHELIARAQRIVERAELKRVKA